MRATCLIIGIVASAPAVQAQNQIANGSFESALDGFDTTGTVFAATSELSRDFLDPVRDDWLATDGEFFASIWSTDSASTDASSLSLTFEAEAGLLLSFDYFFDFGDFAPDYDSAFGVLSNSSGEVGLFEHNTAVSNQLESSENIEWNSVSFLIEVADTYTLTFTATDSNGSFESILGVDNIVLIPTPGAAAILALAGACVAGRRRR